jgi:hypothetical protein
MNHRLSSTRVSRIGNETGGLLYGNRSVESSTNNPRRRNYTFNDNAQNIVGDLADTRARQEFQTVLKSRPPVFMSVAIVEVDL